MKERFFMEVIYVFWSFKQLYGKHMIHFAQMALQTFKYNLNF